VIDFGRFEALTFDCYGTLVDWESGILVALRTLLGDAAGVADEDALLERFGRYESQIEAAPFRSYREVLREVARRFLDAYAVEPDPGAIEAFAASVGAWPVFDDTVEALQGLGRRYRLAIVSNVDDDLFAGSASQLGVDWAEVVTAEQVRSYKPARAHFDEVLRRLELPVDRVLHVAQSLYHDIAPAKELGFTCAWVDRRSERTGSGATPPARAVPDLRVTDLASLAAAAAD
jgi:2-haloacid dehalogenase